MKGNADRGFQLKCRLLVLATKLPRTGEYSAKRGYFMVTGIEQSTHASVLLRCVIVTSEQRCNNNSMATTQHDSNLTLPGEHHVEWQNGREPRSYKALVTIAKPKRKSKADS